MDVHGKFGEHEIPLTNRVWGPHCMLQNEFFSLGFMAKHKVRRSHKSSRKKNRLVLTVSTYVINQQNFWGISILHWKETWDGRNPYRVVNDSATYSSIFGGLGNKFTKWFFPEGLLMYQTSSGFCWCLLQRKTVCFENSDNTLTQFGRFMLLMNHQNVLKNVYFTPLNQSLLKREIDSSRCAVSV